MRTGVAIATAALLLSASSVLAGPVFVGTTTLTDSYGNLSGGEFRASTSGLTINPASLGEVAGQFETFCLEEFEGTSFGIPWSADLNDRTVADPTNPNYDQAGEHGGAQDPISDATAYLYIQFLSKTLAGYTYTPGAARATSADGLQIAIWALEDERAAPGMGQTGYNFWKAATDAVAAGFKNNGRVAVLNLYEKFPSGLRNERQDVLVLVPLPTAVFSGMATLGGLCFIRRRRA